MNGDAVGKNNTKLMFDGCEISLLPKKSTAAGMVKTTLHTMLIG